MVKNVQSVIVIYTVFSVKRSIKYNVKYTIIYKTKHKIINPLTFPKYLYFIVHGI